MGVRIEPQPCRSGSPFTAAGGSTHLPTAVVFQLGLGESWLIDEAGVAVGLAVAHAWPQAETREGELRLKLLALDPERGTAAQFHALLDTLEAEAVARGLDAIATRVCTRARGGYWTLLAERGYALCEPKVRMKRGAHPDYEPTDGYYFDDWL